MTVVVPPAAAAVSRFKSSTVVIHRTDVNGYAAIAPGRPLSVASMISLAIFEISVASKMTPFFTGGQPLRFRGCDDGSIFINVVIGLQHMFQRDVNKS
jgi:hypothetical protein